MSRIGKLPIHVPAGVTVTIKDNVVTVKGPKGEMTQAVNPDINVTLEDGIIHLTRPTDEKNHRALHGLYRSLINNMVVGCSEGYKKGTGTCRCWLPCDKYRSAVRSFFRLYSQHLHAVA